MMEKKRVLSLASWRVLLPHGTGATLPRLVVFLGCRDAPFCDGNNRIKVRITVQ